MKLFHAAEDQFVNARLFYFAMKCIATNPFKICAIYSLDPYFQKILLLQNLIKSVVARTADNNSDGKLAHKRFFCALTVNAYKGGRRQKNQAKANERNPLKSRCAGDYAKHIEILQASFYEAIHQTAP